MFSILLTSIFFASSSANPTEIKASAATSSGTQAEITITQPENYIQTLTETPTISTPEQAITQKLEPQKATTLSCPVLKLYYNQSSTVSPKISNPLDYINKIENTIYQLDDRLIIIQSIPIKYIKKALTPNIQPTIKNYPTF